LRKAGIIGAGAWGTALAIVLADNGYDVMLWDRSSSVVSEINENRRASRLLGIHLPKTVSATCVPEEAIEGSSIVISAIPSTVVSNIASVFGPLIEKDALLVSATKGLDPETLRRPSQVWIDAVSSLKERTVVLSGPNFAVEISQRLPAATVIAGAEIARKRAQEAFWTPYLRAYTNWDIIGVELGGAFKNIIALACGMAEGAKLGFNGQAAIISRGITEIARLGMVLGAEPFTFAGLSGLGDLVLTSTGHLSRNRQAGIAVGRGEPISQFLDRTGYTVEGLSTVKSAVSLAEKHGVTMPITEIVYKILYQGISVRQGLYETMSREKRPEHDQ
jgi:glycerol-3-phosphate dehydrogenase (NAD(P)+)